MDTNLIRKLWSAVESYPSNALELLDDSSLMTSLINLLRTDPSFDIQKIPAVSDYISARLPLIRDMCQSL